MKRFIVIALSILSITSLNAQGEYEALGSNPATWGSKEIGDSCNPNLLGSCGTRGLRCQRLLGAKNSDQGVCVQGSQEVMYESGIYPEVEA